MATLVQQFNLGSASTRLKSQVAAAVMRVATSVRSEPANQPYPQAAPGVAMSANRSTKRQALAIAVLSGGAGGYVEAFARHCANNATIVTEATFAGDAIATDSAIVDGDVIFVVASQWDVTAGVLVSEIP